MQVDGVIVRSHILVEPSLSVKKRKSIVPLAG